MKLSHKLYYFIVPFIVPIFLIIQSYIGYVQNPVRCDGGDFKTVELCASFFAYLFGDSFGGAIESFIIVSIFLLGLCISAIIYCFRNKKKYLGWALLGSVIILGIIAVIL